MKITAESNLRSPVISGDHVGCHHEVTNIPSQPKVQDLQRTILLDDYVAGFQVSVDDTC